MFETYLHDEGTAFRLELVGDMNESALREVEACWTTASSVPRNTLVLDLRHLTGADEASRAWVEEKYRAGACLRADTPFSESFVEEVTGKQLLRKSRASSGWLNGWLTWLSWARLRGPAED